MKMTWCSSDADSLVVGIRHINIACAINRDAVWIIETCLAARAVDAADLTSQTSQRADHASGGNFADHVIPAVGDGDNARNVYRNTSWAPETPAAAGVAGQRAYD